MSNRCDNFFSYGPFTDMPSYTLSLFHLVIGIPIPKSRHH